MKIYLVFFGLLVYCFSGVFSEETGKGKVSSREEIQKKLEEIRNTRLDEKEIKRRLSLLKETKRQIISILKKNASIVSITPFLVSHNFTYEDDFREIQYIKVIPSHETISEIAQKGNSGPIVTVLEKGSDFLVTQTNPHAASVEIEEKKINSGKYPVIDFVFDKEAGKWLIETIRYDRD